MSKSYPIYRDGTHRYTVAHDDYGYGYAIVMVPIGGTYADRSLISMECMTTESRTIGYLKSLAEHSGLVREVA